MKIKHRKLMVYILQHATLMFFYLREDVTEVKLLLLKLIVAIGILFVGGAVANTLIKSKHFQEGLVDK